MHRTKKRSMVQKMSSITSAAIMDIEILTLQPLQMEVGQITQIAVKTGEQIMTKLNNILKMRKLQKLWLGIQTNLKSQKAIMLKIKRPQQTMKTKIVQLFKIKQNKQKIMQLLRITVVGIIANQKIAHCKICSSKRQKKKKNLKAIKSPSFPTKRTQISKQLQERPFKFGNLEPGIAKEEIFQKKLFWLRDFNFKINYGNYVFAQNSQNTIVSYKVSIGKGNNSQLIRRMFKQRWWWTIVEFNQINECNFVWTQIKVNEYLQQLKPNQTRKIYMQPEKNSENDELQQQIIKEELQQNLSQASIFKNHTVAQQQRSVSISNVIYLNNPEEKKEVFAQLDVGNIKVSPKNKSCLLYTSDAADDMQCVYLVCSRDSIKKNDQTS
eukprot:TRINITY_DN8375_c0_g1_i1.p1 TRINITY_DN8375_c0_g1~~TRINITY_DN8375_c0_g1_i1.p1  ORF type:complete len:381 (-),score=49.11 TRINITY_DN8375_c0_g1_i1:10-1152(-)